MMINIVASVALFSFNINFTNQRNNNYNVAAFHHFNNLKAMATVVQDGIESLFRAVAQHPALLTLSSTACHAHVRRDGNASC